MLYENRACKIRNLEYIFLDLKETEECHLIIIIVISLFEIFYSICYQNIAILSFPFYDFQMKTTASSDLTL